MIGFVICEGFQIIGRALVFEIEVFFDVILNDYPSVILNASEESCCKILRCRSG